MVQSTLLNAFKIMDSRGADYCVWHKIMQISITNYMHVSKLSASFARKRKQKQKDGHKLIIVGGGGELSS